MADSFLNKTGLGHFWARIKTYVASAIADAILHKLDDDAIATASEYGIIKLNPGEAVELNENGQLIVGGRLGQFPGGGVYYPTTIEPTDVGSSSFLMTDGAKNLQVSSRDFAILAGANVTLRGSHAAGTTTYRVSNTYSNRFMLSAAIGGRMAIDQADATANGTAAILSVEYANGTPFKVHFGANEADNDIIVTTDRSINPNAAITKARVYGVVSSNDVIAVGQGVSSPKGKAISLGQSTKTDANQAFAVGNSVHILGNNSGGIGRYILIDKIGCFAAGEGHDFTNATNGTSAFGYWSVINANTKFAVGNGTAYNNTSNIFEVTDDSGATGLVVKSPGGNKFKITVSDAGAISATAL